ncbi:MAG: tryptophan synthase subunit alpha [Alphaproteobacteria bacterium]|nr:tryptophan synthase subunit alpha [Alphaproteobacteria bacterium]MBV9694871.1 tryptophan synthase subunit alpha [Alphaproteobacteria bacterium]
MSRISQRFAELKKHDRAAFVPFITAGDPNFDTGLALLEALPQAGADLIELGIPFSDPMADGPVNQASYLRALEAGMTLVKVLELVRRFRKNDKATPLVLMGSYNPIHAFGTARFARDAAEAGVDGLLIVDLPPEEDEVLRVPAALHGLDVVRFVTPTSDAKRLRTILEGASGYLYYVSMAGITGTRGVQAAEVDDQMARLKGRTALPVTVGFGIKTPEQAADIARIADGVVVGSAIVERISANRTLKRTQMVAEVIRFCGEMAKATHDAREGGSF